jgi:hypothetical protein
MTDLERLVARLETISNHPCHCDPCKHAGRLARDALMQIAPSGEKLMNMERESAEFLEAERNFRADEEKRLQGVIEYIGRGRCVMTQTRTNVPLKSDLIPALPFGEGLSPQWRSKLQRYQALRRKSKLEYIENPKIPGSYLIK